MKADLEQAEVIAKGLSERDRAYVLATPMQFPTDAGIISYHAGVQTGGGEFAGFARKRPELFTRLRNYAGTCWHYRLTPLGLAVRSILERKQL